MVQRCLAMPTLLKARITIVIFAVGIVALNSVCCYTGLVIYAAFHDCDPVKTKTISKSDQLLPYFVMKIARHIPGLPGVFVAGVFSAALSTMSTGLNSMTGVILQDFIRPLRKKPLSEERASLCMKAIVVVLGIIFVGLAIAVDKLGALIQTSGSLSGITAGTLLGIFTLGMLFPWANSKGALVGGVCSAIFVGWISIGTQLEIRAKRITFPEKPVSVEGCDNSTLARYHSYVNRTQVAFNTETSEPLPIYTVSYLYYTLIGVLVAVVVGLAVSFLTGPNDPDQMDPKLFSPVIHRFLKAKHDGTTEEKLLKKRQRFAQSKTAAIRESDDDKSINNIT
ncbi:UNVERIFIED_CONTAM: hypothetical protein PYX00_004221 [Menopon gallinae]|uniref:Sodium-coupled monocarboxylate transporter 2 n=1 Tax=Menopon gallinae TaxID=328185 RepID=A0AAW2I4S3_9NEOP